MYRIELSPGEETAFRSIEELAVAIRRKVVTSHARIYHNATGTWLPIQFHPHYKIACSMPLSQADLVAGPRVAPLSTLKLGDQQAQAAPALTAPSNRQAATQAALTAWPEPRPSSLPAATSPVRDVPKQAVPTVPPIQLGTPAPEPRSTVENRPMEPRRLWEPRQVVEPRRVVDPVRTAPPVRTPEPRLIQPRATEPARAKSSRRRKSHRSLHVALAGAVFIACVHLAVSGASSVSGTALRRTPRQLIEAPAEALKDLTPRTVAAVMPVLQSIPVPMLGSASSPEPVIRKAAVTTTGFPKRAAIVTPTPAPVAIDSAPSPVIEAAPESAPVMTPDLINTESFAPAADTTRKTSLKRMLRTIGGTPATAGKPAKP
jgi:hypothetical protein